jgi:hypothetical protein
MRFDQETAAGLQRPPAFGLLFPRRLFTFSMFGQWRIVLFFQVSQAFWPGPVAVTISCDY